MDELEFRKRVYADPRAPGQEVVDAARENPALKAILDEAQQLENTLDDLVNKMPVPEGLKARLLSLPEEEAAVTQQPAANDASFFQYYAIAASLVLALGVTFSMIYNPGPSSADLVFGNEVLAHLYHEMTEINAIGSGIESTVMPMTAINDAMSDSGTRLVRAGFNQDSPVRFAKPCNILPAHQSAHLMMEGSQGAVSVIVINNSPVDVEYKIRDDRFSGVVIPMDEGNMILIGEEGEELDDYKDLFAENVEWVI